jgi:uncharacterized membrane protein
MWWWNDYWQMPWMWGPFFMVLFMALGMGMMWVMMRGHSHPGGRRNEALDILNARLASGDINLQEYQERRRAIDA